MVTGWKLDHFAELHGLSMISETDCKTWDLNLSTFSTKNVKKFSHSVSDTSTKTSTVGLRT